MRSTPEPGAPPSRRWDEWSRALPSASTGLSPSGSLLFGQRSQQPLQRAYRGLVKAAIDARRPKVALERGHHELGLLLEVAVRLDVIAVPREHLLHLGDERSTVAHADAAVRR